MLSLIAEFDNSNFGGSRLSLSAPRDDGETQLHRMVCFIMI